jgi:hypothetical protein
MSRGRTLSVLLGGIALVAFGAAFAWRAQALAETTQINDLRAAASGHGTDGNRAAALKELAALDTTDSRTALESLADAKDDQLAARAALTIGQADQSGGRAKLKRVFEDTSRAHGVRVAAFLAWSRLEAKDGASWQAIEAYAKNHYSTGSKLEASVTAAKNVLFPTTNEGR